VFRFVTDFIELLVSA